MNGETLNIEGGETVSLSLSSGVVHRRSTTNNAVRRKLLHRTIANNSGL